MPNKLKTMLIIWLVDRLGAWECLITAVKLIGWNVSIEDSAEDDIVHGLVIGDDDFLVRHNAD